MDGVLILVVIGEVEWMACSYWWLSEKLNGWRAHIGGYRRS
jgi:hypothetical protein